MNLWARIKTLVKAKLRSWRKNEDPREALRKNLAKMEKYLQQIKKSSLELGREKGTLRRRVERLDHAVEEYEEEAREALKLGEEKQAELALKEKYNVLHRKKQLQENIQALKERIVALERSKDTLKNRIEIFRTKEAELDALRSASEAELRINEITAGMSEDAFTDINQAVRESERKLQQIQAKVKATQEIMEGGDLTNLRDKLDQIGEGETEVDMSDLDENGPEHDLKRLKRSLNEEDRQNKNN